jgi:hypothetical protein
LSALATARELFRDGERGGFAQIREALRLDPSVGVFIRALALAFASKQGRANGG